MEAFFSYGFLQRAVVAGIFVAIACALLGVFLILRRDAMIGHGLAHVTFAGVAIGLLLHVLPLLTALAVAVLTALMIVKLKEKAGIYGDTAIAIFSSVGFALGILIISLARGFNVDLFGYLFGDILAISVSEVWLSIALAVVVVIIIIVNYHKFLFMTFDRETAKASGVKVERLDIILTILTAITVVLGMKVVGILLVSALIVIPSASGLQIASNFKYATIVSAIIAVSSVVLGLFASVYFDFPASGSIVVISFTLFLLIFAVKQLRK